MPQTASLEEPSIGSQVGALAIVVFMAGIAGCLVGLLGGYHFPKVLCFKGYNLKPILTAIVIPPLIGMIILGIITRNFFGQVSEDFPEKWASFIKSICLAILLIRGGLQVTFKGKSILILVMTALPQSVEASIAAWITKGLTDLPIFVCYALGYTLSCISPSIIVPGCISLDARGFGKKKGIASAMIAAGTFDDILCIIMFGIFSALAFFQAGEKGAETKGPGYEIGMIILEIVVGLAVGIGFGFLSYLFKYIQTWKSQIWLKAIWCICIAIAFVLASDLTGFKEAKYIAALFFGYVSFRMWGADKPSKNLAQIWFFLQPILFGCVGGGLNLSSINVGMIGYSLVIIIVAVVMRFLTTFMVTYSRAYNVKERIFMAICWLPKATVQAVLSGMFLKEAKSRELEDFIKYGEFIQTTAIISILLMAPIGAILINSMGPKLLTNDIEVEMKEKMKKEKEGLEDPKGMVQKESLTKSEIEIQIEDEKQGVADEGGSAQRVVGLDPRVFSTATDMVPYIAL